MDRFSFDDSIRFEEDSLCSWSSEPESLCNNWRGWKKPTPVGGSGNGGGNNSGAAGTSGALVGGSGNGGTGGNLTGGLGAAGGSNGGVGGNNGGNSAYGGSSASGSCGPGGLGNSANTSAGGGNGGRFYEVSSLAELAARCVASYIPFELVEHVYPPVPEQLQLRIAFWSFPDNEEDIRLYSCLANSSADEFNRGDQLFRMRAVKDPLQIGFHLSATVVSQTPRTYFNVAVTFDRRRISSCNCTCTSTAYWCSHVVAVCLHRIHCAMEVCLRAPVSESLTRLQRDQLQKFAQYLISELPQQILPTAQRLLDELLSAQPTAINTVCGAPDPTAGASINDQTSWYLDEKTLHNNIKRILIKFCLPAPIVFSDVNYLTNSAPPAAAEWSSLLRPLRGREPEGMWNLLSIVREMYRRCDRNAVRLLEIITEECMACDQILIWWFQTKLALMMGSHGHSGGKHSNTHTNATALQHACSSLCDEIVALWRLAALNPGLAPDERDMLHAQFTAWHLKILDRVVKSRMMPSSYTNKHQQNSRSETELFVGFKPAIEACYLDWEDYPIAGVTHTHDTNPIYYSPFTCFKHTDVKGDSGAAGGQLNATQAVMNNNKHYNYFSTSNDLGGVFKQRLAFRERYYPAAGSGTDSNGGGGGSGSGPGGSNAGNNGPSTSGLTGLGPKNPLCLAGSAASANSAVSDANDRRHDPDLPSTSAGVVGGASAGSSVAVGGVAAAGVGGVGDGNRSSASSEGFCENDDFGGDNSSSHNYCTDAGGRIIEPVQAVSAGGNVIPKSLTESDSQSSFDAVSQQSVNMDGYVLPATPTNVGPGQPQSHTPTGGLVMGDNVNESSVGGNVYRTNASSTSDTSSASSASSSASSASGSSHSSTSSMMMAAAGDVATPPPELRGSKLVGGVPSGRRLSKDESFSSSSDEFHPVHPAGSGLSGDLAAKAAGMGVVNSLQGGGELTGMPSTSAAARAALASAAGAGASGSGRGGALPNQGAPLAAGNVESGNAGVYQQSSTSAVAAARALAAAVAVASDKPHIFSNVRPSEDAWDILLARAEGLHAHGHGREACILAVRLAEQMLANPPNLLLELPPAPKRKGKKQNVNPISHQLTVVASSTLSKCAFLCTVLSENSEHYHIAFRICLFALEMPRPPASTKPLEVKLANQEADILALLKKIPLGAAELQVIRERAEQLRSGTLKTRGEALLPINLATFIFDALVMPNGNGITPLGLSLSPSVSGTGLAKGSRLNTPYKQNSDENLGFEAAVAALGLKANVSEAEHPLLCEGTRRQRGDLALTLLYYYKDEPRKIAKIMEKLLDRDIHTLLKAPLLPAYYSNNPPVRSPNNQPPRREEHHDFGSASNNSCTGGGGAGLCDLFPADYGGSVGGNSRPHSSTSAELEVSMCALSMASNQVANSANSGGANLSNTPAGGSQTLISGGNSGSNTGANGGNGAPAGNGGPANQVVSSTTTTTTTTTSRSKESRYKGKRAYPSIPNQPSEASAHFMFELAKNVLTKAGGNSSTSLFTQASTNQNHHGPHRALHMCAFQLGLYALGLHNCVSPNWLSRTYSSHVSWILGQAMEIGAPAISFLIDTWEAHLTPPEAAGMADRASRGWDGNMVYPAAELALSVLPHAAALNPNEIQRAILQCKEQSDLMLERACITVENAAKGGGVYPEVLFQVARYWYELYMRNTPNSEHEQHDDQLDHSAVSLSALIESQQQHELQQQLAGMPPVPNMGPGAPGGPVGGPPQPPPGQPGGQVVVTTAPQPFQPGVATLAPIGLTPYSPYSFCQGIYHHNLSYPPNQMQMYISAGPPPPQAYPGYQQPPGPPPVQQQPQQVVGAPQGQPPGHQGPPPPFQPPPHFQAMQQQALPPQAYQAMQQGPPAFAPPPNQGGPGPGGPLVGPGPGQHNIQQAVAAAAAAAAAVGYYGPPPPPPHKQQTAPPPQGPPTGAVQMRQHPHQQQQHQPPGVYPFMQQQPPPPQQNPSQSQVRQRNPHQFTATQLRYLLAAYNVGMLAMETLARRVHDDRPQAKYARNPPYGEDVKWLLRISKKLGTQYLHQFCICAVNSIVSPFVLHDVAIESAHYLGRNNHQLVMQHLRSALTPLVQKCQQMYIQCIHQKLYHLTQADYEEFASIVVAARAAFQITPEGSAQFKDWLQSIKRSKSCKKELWTQINSALQSNSK